MDEIVRKTAGFINDITVSCYITVCRAGRGGRVTNIWSRDDKVGVSGRCNAVFVIIMYSVCVCRIAYVRIIVYDEWRYAIIMLRILNMRYNPYTVQLTLYAVMHTLYGIHCTTYTLRHILYVVHSTTNTARRTLYDIHYTTYTALHTLHDVHCTTYTAHTLYTI